jgi:hypothetical protein
MGVFNVMAGKGPGPGGGSATVPDAPTITRAILTNTTAASISFVAPAYNGGNPVKSYTAVSTPGSLSGTVSQSGSGSVTVSGLTSGTAYTFVVYATNDIGNSANSASSGNANSEFGYATFTVAGANTWTVPANVTSVSIVMVGGGGAGGDNYGAGGGGGALTYINNLSVVPGNTYSLSVGASGSSSSRTGGTSWFSNSTFLYAGGGSGGSGGSGPARTSGGGGGAGGYAGNGGIGGANTTGGISGGNGGTGGGLVPGLVTYSGGKGGDSVLGQVRTGSAGAGVGGSGAGGAGGYIKGCGGGGISFQGQSSVDNGGNATTPGAATAAGATAANTTNGGSGGNSAITVGVSTQFNYNGPTYGGGGGGLLGVTYGGPGFVRIIWPGDVRQYPTTMVKNGPSY